MSRHYRRLSSDRVGGRSVASLFLGGTARSLVVLVGLLAIVSGAEAVSPRQLVEVVDFGGPVVSPDGGHIAFRTEQASIERNTYDTVWYVQRMDGASPPRRVASGGTPLRDSAGLSLPAHAVWSADGRWIYYLALVAAKVDVWRAAADGTGAEALTHDPADVRAFLLGDDGRVLKFKVGATREEVVVAEEAEYDNGIRIDDRVPIGQSLFRSGYIEGRRATQRLGFWFNRVSLLADVPDQWKALDLATGKERELVPAEVPSATIGISDLAEGVPESWKLAHDSATGRVALLTRIGDAKGLRDKPDVELSILPDKGTRTSIRCTADPCVKKPITDIQWRPASNEVLFTVTNYADGHAQSIFLWDVTTGAVRLVTLSSGLIGGGARWAPGLCGASSSALACIASEADRPPRLERIDLETGKRHILFDPNAALAHDMKDLTPVRLLRWKDEQGRQFTGQYFRAQGKGEAPFPLFVTYYQCSGFVRGGSGDEWPLATLAARGVSALCINALPFGFDAVARYDAGRSAVESAIRLLDLEGEIDRDRVGMGGLSFGAETALWTAIHSDLLAAVSVATPVISQQYYLLGSNRGETFLDGLRENWQLAGPDETPEQWQKLAPTLNLEKIHVPLLMQVPEQEFLQTLDYAIPLMRDRRADVYVFPYEPHIKFLPRHKLAAYERNLDWFRFWLQKYEDSDPSKAEQYTHWREMRTRLNERENMPSVP